MRTKRGSAVLGADSELAIENGRRLFRKIW